MNMQGKNAQNPAVKGRMMDFSPVRKTAGTISGATNSTASSAGGRTYASGTNNRTSTFAATNSAIASPTRARTLTSAYTYSLSERELERKKQAKKERERREEIQRQIELQNQTMDYNRRRIEAAKQELARSQAEESLRNRELRLQREIEEKQQAIAKKQAEQEALLRRQAIERENQAKQRRYEYEKQRAKEELAKRKVGELPRATGRIPVGSASLAPKMRPAPTAISVTNAASAGSISVTNAANSLAGSAINTVNSAASKFKAPSPVSRIQITASPSRTLFGRIRPAKKVESEINSESQTTHSAKAPVPTTLVSPSVRDALQNYDNYDEIEDLEALFDSVDNDQLHGDNPASTSGNPSATMYYPTAGRSNTISTLPKNQESALTSDSIDSAFAPVDQSEPSEIIATVAPARSVYSFTDNEKPKTASLYAESDIANNNSNYVLGGRSPFINTDKVQKRPLAAGQDNFTSSDFSSELLGPGSKIKDYTFEEDNNSRKTIYAKNKSEKTKAKQQAVIIDDPSMRKTNLSLVFALIAMSIFGALVGAIVYFAFFQ